MIHLTTGAVITAAGLSSRMGAFKPMLPIGSASVVQHVIRTFRQAGVANIAVVTGHNAESLRSHLADSGVVFLHNENYRTTEMFDSAKIGLSHWKDTCDRVLFTPVDVPLFTAGTVEALLRTSAPAACPVCNGRRGHPLILSSQAVHAILADSGEDGMRGALSRLDSPLCCVPVDDPGTLRDADTPEEFSALLEYYHGQLGHTVITQALCPSDQEIEEMLQAMGTPAHVRSHCAAVARKGAELAAQTVVPVRPDLLRAACLLHDMAKAQGRDHARLAAEHLRERGYPALADLVAWHHDLPENAPAEAELLYLADKLVRETRTVTLDERFAASRNKCRTPEAVQVWTRRYEAALQIADRHQLDLDSPGRGAPSESEGSI